MTIHVTEHLDLTVGQLQDLDVTPESVSTVFIEVSRRNEPGAKQFAGVQLLSHSEDAAAFDTIDDALAFIDDLHRYGVPGALRAMYTEEMDDAAVVSKLKFTPDNISPTEYIRRTGCADPFNLNITPHVEQCHTISGGETAQCGVMIDHDLPMVNASPNE
jgi:hypothetical protein